MSGGHHLLGARYQTPLAVRIGRGGAIWINRAAMDALEWPEKVIIGVQPPDRMVILPAVQGDHRAYTVYHVSTAGRAAHEGRLHALAPCVEAELLPQGDAKSQRYMAILCEDATGRVGLFVRADLTMPDGRRGKRTLAKKVEGVTA